MSARPDDIADLLGDESGRRRMGRPTREEAERRLLEKQAAITMHPSVFRKPVGIQFLADVVGRQPKQIQRRLEKCPVAAYHHHQGKPVPRYNFMEAISYLIEPKVDVEDWFAQQNMASLPPYISKAYWDTATQRNRALLQANDLWHSEDVLAVLGRIGLIIKDESNIWIENLPGRDQLTDAQYNALREDVFRFQTQIRERMLQMSKESATRNMTATIQNELAEADRRPPPADE